MAHVCEELALGPVGFHGPVAGDQEVGIGVAQLGRACLDGPFEIGVLLLQLPVAVLDLRQHVVEPGDELADFVGASARRPADRSGRPW